VDDQCLVEGHDEAAERGINIDESEEVRLCSTFRNRHPHCSERTLEGAAVL
jgi:hypothetical protein